ncbi:MAG: hypothetical protein PUD83_02650 [Bacteroidales bacterium]|nr:hypothetical protein [Bacteroidales bacterium]
MSSICCSTMLVASLRVVVGERVFDEAIFSSFSVVSARCQPFAHAYHVGISAFAMY